MENAVIYARYSSEKQTEQSIEGQIHVCEEYAKSNNLKIIDTYIDRAKSGRNDNREAFQKMIQDSASKKFSVVLIYALDRFARNRYDSAIHKATLKKNNVRIISATQPITENPEGILLESMLEGLAEYYSAELAQKLARGRKESVSKGQYTGGFVPYGYQICNKKYVILENEAKNVRLIFSLFKNFHNYKDVMIYLENNCIYNRQSSKFKRHQIHNILTNPIYTGLLKSGNNTCEKATPVIIDQKEFDEIQNIMRNHYIQRSKSPAKFLLAGKIICGECGENYTGDSATGRHGKIYYYYCCHGRKANYGCKMQRISKDKLEKFVYQHAIAELKSPVFLDYCVTRIEEILQENNDDDEIQRLKTSLISIEKKLENISAAIEEGIINDKIKAQNETLVDEKEKLTQQIYELEHTPLHCISSNEIRDYLTETYSKSNMDTILSALVYRVYIYKDHVVIIFNIKDLNDPTQRKKLDIHFDKSPRWATNKKHRQVFFFVDRRQFASAKHRQVRESNGLSRKVAGGKFLSPGVIASSRQ